MPCSFRQSSGLKASFGGDGRDCGKWVRPGGRMIHNPGLNSLCGRRLKQDGLLCVSLEEEIPWERPLRCGGSSSASIPSKGQTRANRLSYCRKDLERGYRTTENGRSFPWRIAVRLAAVASGSGVARCCFKLFGGSGVSRSVAAFKGGVGGGQKDCLLGL